MANERKLIDRWGEDSMVDPPSYDMPSSDPPSYGESTSRQDQLSINADGDSKQPLRFSVREEIGLGRSQHVAAISAALLPHIRARARRGLSKSTLLLLPSTQGLRSWEGGRLVGFPEDGLPILVQLEGDRDTLEFWTQKVALEMLQSELLEAMFDSTPQETRAEAPLPTREPPRRTKSSLWTRKQSKTPEVSGSLLSQAPTKPPVEVSVEKDEAHFRTETEYGLYETQRVRCVLVTVEVR